MRFRLPCCSPSLSYSYPQDLIVIYRKLLPGTTTLNHGRGWPNNETVSWEAQLLYQDMFLSMFMTACRMCLIFQQCCAVALLTGFKDELRHKTVSEKRSSFSMWHSACKFPWQKMDQGRQIADQKHEVYTEYIDCKFNKVRKIYLFVVSFVLVDHIEWK